MRMDIKLLGSLEAAVDDVSLACTARKARQLLALLALNAGYAVPVSKLIEELWGATPPRSADACIQTYVAQLRRWMELALRGDRRQDSKEMLLTERIGYRLNVPPEDIDVKRYEQLAHSGRRAIEAGDYVATSRILESALSLWRGYALADIPTGMHLGVEVVRLEESRLVDLDLRIEADLRLGRHRELLGELAALCVRFPMSENFYAQYMLALYRSGQQWRALEMYQRLRNTMVAQLGIDPAPRVQQLHQAILCGAVTVERPDARAGELRPAEVLAR